MLSKSLGCLISFLVLCFFVQCHELSALTRDQILTNRRVILIYAEFDRTQKAYSRAEQRLRKHLELDPTDSEAWAYLGLISEDMGKVNAARDAFVSSIKVAPSGTAGRFHYFYADFLNRNQKLVEARVELKRALGYDSSEGSAERALELIQVGEPLPPYVDEIDLSSWSANLGFSGGYDSNVLLLSESTLDSVSISDTQSPSFLFFGNLKYQNTIANGRFEAKAFSSSTFYPAESAQSFSALAEKLAVSWIWDLGTNFSLGFGNNADINFLNSDSYEYFNMTNRFYPEFTWHILPQWKSKWTVGGSYLHFNQDNPGTGNERSGYSLNPEWHNEVYLKSTIFTFGGGYDRVWADGENFNLHSFQIPISFTAQLPDAWVCSLSFRWILNNYSDSSDSRVDYAYQPGLMMGRKFEERISAYLQYGFALNTSSTDSAQYSKHTAALLVNYAFK